MRRLLQEFRALLNAPVDEARRNFMFRDAPASLLAFIEAAKAVEIPGILPLLVGESSYQIDSYQAGSQIPDQIIERLAAGTNMFPELKGRTWRSVDNIVAPGDWGGDGPVVTVVNYSSNMRLNPNSLAQVHEMIANFPDMMSRIPYIDNTSMSLSKVYLPTDTLILIVPPEVAQRKTMSNLATLSEVPLNVSYVRMTTQQELDVKDDEEYRSIKDHTAAKVVNELSFSVQSVFPLSPTTLAPEKYHDLVWLYSDIFANSLSRTWSRRQMGRNWSTYKQEFSNLFLDAYGKPFPMIIFPQKVYERIPQLAESLIR